MDLPSAIIGNIISFTARDEWSNIFLAVPQYRTQKETLGPLIKKELKALEGVQAGIQIKNPIKGFGMEIDGQFKLIEWVDCTLADECVHLNDRIDTMEYYMPNLHVSYMFDLEEDEIAPIKSSCDILMGLGIQWKFHPFSNKNNEPCNWCLKDINLSLYYVC